MKFIEENKMIQYGDSVVLGVSGGADSLCLLIMLSNIAKDYKLALTVVHVNHHIRGQEADEDQKFVEDFCKKLNVRCITFHIEAEKLAKEMKCSEEEAGRIARYELFDRVLMEENADKIAVAHNLNDDSETILFNLFRGTGIKGLSGITPVRDKIIRPILCLERKEIEQYLKENNYSYRTDSTNLSDDYTRNKLRNKVLPYVKEHINSNAVINCVKAGNDLAEIEDYLAMQTEEEFGKYVVKIEKGYFIKASAQKLHPVIKKRIIRSIIELLSGKLKDVTRLHVDFVLDMFEKNVGSMADLPYGIKAERQYEGIILYTYEVENEIIRNDFQEMVIYKEGVVFQNEYIDTFIEDKGNFGENVPEMCYTKWIDCDKIKGALVVRKRQTGDYITIDDNGRTKKLKDYFINQKIPKDIRDDILLVADGQHIVWIVGYRLGSYYKITDSTVKVLKLTYRKNN